MTAHYQYPIQNQMESFAPPPPPPSAPPSSAPITPPQKKRRGRPAKRLPFCTEMFYSTPSVPTHSSVPISPEESFNSFHSHPAMNVQAHSATPLLSPPEPSPVNRSNSYPTLNNHQQNLSISSISSLTSLASSSAGTVEIPVSAFELGPGLAPLNTSQNTMTAGPAIASNSPYGGYYGHQLMVERSNHSDTYQQNIFLQPGIEPVQEQYHLQYNQLKHDHDEESLLPLRQGFYSSQNSSLRTLQASATFQPTSITVSSSTSPLIHPIPVLAAPQHHDDYFDLTLSGNASGTVSGAVSPNSMPPCTSFSSQSSVVTSPILSETTTTLNNRKQQTLLERRRSSPHRSSTNLRRLQLSRKNSLSAGSSRLPSGLMSAPPSANPYNKRRISLSIQHGQAVVAHEDTEDDLIPPQMTRHVSYDVRDLARGIDSAFSSFGINSSSSSSSSPYSASGAGFPMAPTSTTTSLTTPEDYLYQPDDEITLFPQYSPKPITSPSLIPENVSNDNHEEDYEQDPEDASYLGQKDDARDALRRALAQRSANISSKTDLTITTNISVADDSDSDGNQNQNHQQFYYPISA